MLRLQCLLQAGRQALRSLLLSSRVQVILQIEDVFGRKGHLVGGVQDRDLELLAQPRLQPLDRNTVALKIRSLIRRMGKKHARSAADADALEPIQMVDRRVGRWRTGEMKRQDRPT